MYIIYLAVILRGNLCTDPMGSWSWILTMMSVMVGPDLCLQPARTTVPGVSCQLSVINYYIITSTDNRHLFI